MKAIKTYGYNVLTAIDYLANAVLAPLLNLIVHPKGARFGDPGETLSSVFGKNVRAGRCKGCKIICKLLHLIDKNHCAAAIQDDEGGRAL